MKKDAYYFPHDSNARHDIKMIQLIEKFGWAGYGVYFAILEIMRDQAGYAIPAPAKHMLLKHELKLEKMDEKELENIILECEKLQLFVEKNGLFFSESFISRMKDIDRKRLRMKHIGRLGGIAGAAKQGLLEHGYSIKVKESKVKERKEKEEEATDSFDGGETRQQPKPFKSAYKTASELKALGLI